MAFTYSPTPQQRPKNVYEQAQEYQTAQAPQQQGPKVNPMQIYNGYNKLSGLWGGGGAGVAANPALLSTAGGSAAGLGGSGLIGSAGGATSAAATQGAGYGLGGSLVGGTGTVGGSTYAAGAGTAAAGGTAAGAGTAAGGGAAAGSGAGTAASSGPIGWIAAAIIANESGQAAAGNRDQGTEKQIEHAFTGKVVEDDASGWGEMVDKGNKLGLKGDFEVGSDFASGDFSNAFKGLEGTFGAKTIKKLI